MPTTAERLDRLEQENTNLKAEVARLSAGAEPAKPVLPPGGQPYVERTASVTVIPDPPPPPVSDDDLRELRRIVGLAHPGLVSASGRGTSEHQALRQFANAFRAVGMLYGTTEMDQKHAVSWWVDHTQSIVDRAAGHNDFTSNDFTAAALARGVWYRAWSASSPPEFGLLRWVPYGSSTAAWPLKDCWRDTLKRGRINPPNLPAREPVDNRTGRLAAGPDR